MPVKVGVPVICPVAESIDAQSGRSVAYQVTGSPERTCGVAEKAEPTVAVNDCEDGSCIVIVGVVPPPPPLLVEMTSETLVGSLVPPGPVAVTEKVVVPAVVGVPAMMPLEELVAAQAGSPVKV